MSDDIAFKIQLGLILPKIKDKLGSELHTIVEELTTMFCSGSTDDSEDVSADLEAIKALFLKDMEIYLDKEVMPAIQASLMPPSDQTADAEGIPDTDTSDEVVDETEIQEEESA